MPNLLDIGNQTITEEEKKRSTDIPRYLMTFFYYETSKAAIYKYTYMAYN